MAVNPISSLQVAGITAKSPRSQREIDAMASELSAEHRIADARGARRQPNALLCAIGGLPFLIEGLKGGVTHSWDAELETRLNLRCDYAVYTPRARPEQERWMAAHELGHIYLHIGLDYHRLPVLSTDFPHGDELDRQANMFAMALLIPEAAIRQHPNHTNYADIAAAYQVPDRVVAARMKSLNL